MNNGNARMTKKVPIPKFRSSIWALLSGRYFGLKKRSFTALCGHSDLRIGHLIVAICLLVVSASAQPSGYQGTGPLLGVAPDIAPPPYELKWTYKTNETERAGVESAPVIANDTVYLADSRGVLHAIELASGKVRWKYDSGDAFATTPLVVDGKVFLGDLSGVFHAVSAKDGAKLWTVDTESSIHASANVAGSRILFANDASDLICVEAADGKVVWKGKGEDRINAAPSIGGGLAYFSGCDAQLRAFDIQTGQQKFAVEIGALAPGSPPLLPDRIIIGTDGGRVIAMSPDGKETLWTYEQVETQAMVYASPSVAGGVVVVGARDRQVHAINAATGKRLWAFKTRGDVDAPAVISAGRVYVGSKDKKLYVLDLKTGEALWEFNAGRGIEAGAAIGGGVIVFADSAGNVFCLGK
jgi:outer membrane protein assembly factor BamB